MEYQLKVLEDDAALFMGSVQNLGAIIWRRTPNAEHIRRVIQHFPYLRDESRGFALLAVLSPECSPIDGKGRAAFDAAMREHRDLLLGIAIVIEAEGIMGGLTRAIARSMSIVSRTPYPVNTYATVMDASRWLAEIMTKRIQQSISVESLLVSLSPHHQFYDGKERPPPSIDRIT